MSDRPESTCAWESLPWDTGFFGFKVGRFVRLPVSLFDLRDSLSEAAAADVSLLYLTHAAENTAVAQYCSGAGGFNADLKRTYTRRTRAELRPSGLEPYVEHPCARRQLRQLAWQAAVESRFRIDPRMPCGAWRRLYGIWIARSISGAIADTVLIDRDQERIKGLITVAKRETSARIGLFAVSPAYRGQGVGTRLLHDAEAWAANQGCTDIEVVTQGTNLAACRAYESAGYTIASDQLVHHFWLEKHDSVQ